MQTSFLYSFLYSKSQHSRGTSKDPDECDESAPGASVGLKHKCCLLKGWMIKRLDKGKLWRVGGWGRVLLQAQMCILLEGWRVEDSGLRWWTRRQDDWWMEQMYGTMQVYAHFNDQSIIWSNSTFSFLTKQTHNSDLESQLDWILLI